MSYLVRKISVARWPDGNNQQFQDANSLSADAITRDLATDGNKQSWWKVENIEEATEIGISFLSGIDSAQASIRLVAVPFEEIKKQFNIENTPNAAATALLRIKEKHYDICDINYAQLGTLATVVAQITSSKKENIIQVKFKDALKRVEELYTQSNELDVKFLGNVVREKLGLPLKEKKA